MTPEQQALADKLTNLQRGVVLGVVAGKSQRQAYYDAGGRAKTDLSADATVSELLSNPNVRAFYDSLIANVAEKAIWTREDSLRTLAEIASGGDENGKTSDRVAAVKELNAMGGWNSAQKIDHTSTDGSMSPKPVVVVSDLTDEQLAKLVAEG